MKFSFSDVSLTPTHKIFKIGWLTIKLRHKNNLCISDPTLLPNLDKNSFVGFVPQMINSRIVFKGYNNILYCDEGVVLKDSILKFSANNSIIYLGKNRHFYKIKINVYNNSAVHIGSDNYFNDVCHIICSENKHIFIGNDNLFSINVVFRNADPHLIYDIANKHRTNPTRSIYIGDHVWIGQNCYFLKGAHIHSGSILGTGSILSKEMESNSIYAGSPAKCIKENIFWKNDSVHNWNRKKTKQNEICNKDEFIFTDTPEQYIDFNQLDMELDKRDVQEKLEYLQFLNISAAKNRFSRKKYDKNPVK